MFAMSRLRPRLPGGPRALLPAFGPAGDIKSMALELACFKVLAPWGESSEMSGR